MMENLVITIAIFIGGFSFGFAIGDQFGKKRQQKGIDYWYNAYKKAWDQRCELSDKLLEIAKSITEKKEGK